MTQKKIKREVADWVRRMHLDGESHRLIEALAIKQHKLYLRSVRLPKKAKPALMKQATKVQSQAMRQLPQYQCTKKVWALKIKDITLTTDGGALITPAEDGYAMFLVEADFVRTHNPAIGGYWVQYSTGYTSWSPAEAFESGYTKL